MTSTMGTKDLQFKDNMIFYLSTFIDAIDAKKERAIIVENAKTR
jgi:hypothetical protein